MTFKKGVKSWNKGRKLGSWGKHTEETKEKMRISAIARKDEISNILREQWRLGIRKIVPNLTYKGLKHSNITKSKISNSKKGKFTESGSWEWKGNKVGYRALHTWVRKYRGVPVKCEHCGKEKTTQKSIHWANKSHEYLRELTDWVSLCVPCHKKYDGYTGENNQKLFQEATSKS